MKRIISLLAVAALTVMLIALSVGPAFADVVKNEKGGPPDLSGDFETGPKARGDSRGPLVTHDARVSPPPVDPDAKNCVLHNFPDAYMTGDCAH
jgi:hypothetical protein